MPHREIAVTRSPVTASKEGLISLRMMGTVTEEDWGRVTTAFEQALGADFGLHLRHYGSGTLSVLMDWEKLEGWESGARSACTVFCMGYQDLVRRVAVVGSDKWRDDSERIGDVYEFAKVRYFESPARDAAMAWLAGR